MDKLRGLWRGRLIDKDEQSDRNEWVEGFLAKRTKSYAKIVNDENMVNYVDPETLGECTGWTDKNGVKIFEGDIVRNSVGALYVIKWDTERLAFVFECFSCKKAKSSRPLVVTYEVIGNVHDYPELLRNEETK